MIPYPGPHAVGIARVETTATDKKCGVLGCMFYPSPSQTATKSKWLIGPTGFYARGFGAYIGAPQFLSNTLLTWLLGAVTIDACVESPARDAAKMPVAVFSHGLGGNQTTYSDLCGTFASRGFLVLSIEHRDRSASVSAKSNYTEKIDYQKPPKDEEESRQFRSSQVEQRVSEVGEGFQLLRDLNDGKQVENLLDTSLPDLKGRIDLDNSVMIGHSFGGVTAISVLQQPNNPFIAGIVLDPWMFALSSKEPLKVPVLSIQSETFHWRKNIAAFREIWDKSTTPPNRPSNTFTVLFNTKHQDVSDLLSIAPSFLKNTIGLGKLDAKVVYDAYDKMCSGFLKKVLDGRSKIADEIVVGDVDAALVVNDEAAFEFLDTIMAPAKV
ncbi:Platelet-activating factor acetylhydrolase [Chytriomyces hyalinus]|nr:Platelet-activating factor acetylhydrolase [Chytriomyces hyalinus]